MLAALDAYLSVTPSLTASAAASRLDWTPSLPRIAETWCVDGLGRDVQPCGDLGVGKRSHEQVQDLELARGQLSRIVDRRAPRSAADAGGPDPAQVLPGGARGRDRAQALKRASALRSEVSSSVWARASAASYGTAETIPQPRGGDPDAAVLERERRGQRAGGDLVLDPGPPPPTAQRAESPGIRALAREGERGVGLARHGGVLALEDAGLGASAGHGSQPLELLRAAGQLEGFVERGPRVRLRRAGRGESRARSAA